MDTAKIGRPLAKAIDGLQKEWSWFSSRPQPARILFDHLPKCGGTTLKNYLGRHYPHRLIFNISGSNPAASVAAFQALPQSKRQNYQLIMGHHAADLIDFAHPNCLKVTLLRDPIERIVSLYYYARRLPHHYLYADLHKGDMDLETFVTSDLSHELQNWYTVHFCGWSRSEVERNPREAVSQALKNCQSYDLVGFLDTYLQFVQSLQEKASLRLEYQDKKLNLSPDRPLLADIPLPIRSKIEEVNNIDLNFYQQMFALYANS